MVVGIELILCTRETDNNSVYDEEGKKFAGGCEENNGDGGESVFEGRRVESGNSTPDSAPKEPRHDLV